MTAVLAGRARLRPVPASLEVTLRSPGRDGATRAIPRRADVTIGRSFRATLHDPCSDLPITWLLFAAFCRGTVLRLGSRMTACVDGRVLAGRQDVALAPGAAGRIRVGRVEVLFRVREDESSHASTSEQDAGEVAGAAAPA